MGVADVLANAGKVARRRPDRPIGNLVKLLGLSLDGLAVRRIAELAAARAWPKAVTAVKAKTPMKATRMAATTQMAILPPRRRPCLASRSRRAERYFWSATRGPLLAGAGSGVDAKKLSAESSGLKCAPWMGVSLMGSSILETSEGINERK